MRGSGDRLVLPSLKSRTKSRVGEVELRISEGNNASSLGNEKRKRRQKRTHFCFFGTLCFVIGFLFLMILSLILRESALHSNPTEPDSFQENPRARMDERSGPSDQNVILGERSKSAQIDRFQQNRSSSLLLQVHVTHHGGTFVCKIMGKKRRVNQRLGGAGRVPIKNCEGGDDLWVDIIQGHNVTSFPWTKQQTSTLIPAIRKRFFFFSYEMRFPKQKFPLHKMDWEHPNLISIYVTRHPLDRALASDYHYVQAFGHANNRTTEQWWQWANHPTTANYALNILSDSPHTNGYKNQTHLEQAKRLLQRFTFVLDITCLEESMNAMFQQLGIQHWDIPLSDYSARKHKDAQTRIQNETVYHHMTERNKWDIALFEYSKSISIVRCEEWNDTVETGLWQ